MTICFQWPNQELIPGFRETMETYLIGVHNAGVQLMSLIAEALQLPSDAFAKFYYSLDEIQSRAKEWPNLPMRSLGRTYTLLFFFLPSGHQVSTPARVAG